MKNYSLLSLLLAVFMMGCSSKQKEAPANALKEESKLLYEFFEQNGNYINSPGTPAIMTAASFIGIMNNQDILVIDLRAPEQYAAGHVKNAINVQPANVPDLFSKHIDAPSFESIIFLCNRGQLSSYVNGIMRLLGNKNTWSVRYGLSSLKTEMSQGWDMVIGNHPDAITDTANVPLPERSQLPVLSTLGQSGFEIAQIQARKLLSQDSKEFFIEYAEVIKNPSAYFIVAYATPDHYTKSGHLPGAVRLTPTQSLTIDAQLLHLPNDKPIVVYCFNGHHSAQAVAYLRMLGYNAYSLLYGANTFMHKYLETNDTGTPRYWSDLQKNDIPFESSKALGTTPVVPTTKVKAVAGGC